MRYSQQVFIFPPWKGIYENDAERKQSFTLAVQTYDVMVDAYQQFGYRLLEVPLLTPSQRADFILDSIQPGTQATVWAKPPAQ